MKNTNITIKNKKEFQRLIKEIAAHVAFAPFCICLVGELGTGKTFFTKNLIKYLSKKPILVSSPSFNLVNIYQLNHKLTGEELEIWHFDLYRLNSEEEITELGLEEALHKHITIIEWADRLSCVHFPKSMLKVELTFCKDDANSRNIKVIFGR